MIELLPEDIAVLQSQTDKILADWWSQLNRWDWPAEIPDPEPVGHPPFGRRSKIMGWIMEKIGFKECLRDWNKERMTSSEFDKWFEPGKLPGTIRRSIEE